MTHATEPASRDEDRPFSRRTSAILGTAAFAAAIAIGLYIYYETLSGFWPFTGALLAVSVLQAFSVLCLIDVLKSRPAMRNGGLWVLGRLLVMVIAGILGGIKMWAYDDLIVANAIIGGLFDLTLIDDER